MEQIYVWGPGRLVPRIHCSPLAIESSIVQSQTKLSLQEI